MSLDQQSATADRNGVDRAADASTPTLAEYVSSALGSVRAEGLEPDEAGLELFDLVTAGELSFPEAIARAVSLYAM